MQSTMTTTTAPPDAAAEARVRAAILSGTPAEAGDLEASGILASWIDNSNDEVFRQARDKIAREERYGGTADRQEYTAAVNAALLDLHERRKQAIEDRRRYGEDRQRLAGELDVNMRIDWASKPLPATVGELLPLIELARHPHQITRERDKLRLAIADAAGRMANADRILRKTCDWRVQERIDGLNHIRSAAERSHDLARAAELEAEVAELSNKWRDADCLCWYVKPALVTSGSFSSMPRG